MQGASPAVSHANGGDMNSGIGTAITRRYFLAAVLASTATGLIACSSNGSKGGYDDGYSAASPTVTRRAGPQRRTPAKTTALLQAVSLSQASSTPSTLSRAATLNTPSTELASQLF